MVPGNVRGADARMYQADGPKFLYLRDLREVREAGKSIVTYQHIHRIGEGEDQIRAAAPRMRDTLEGSDPIRLPFHRGTARVFFVIPQPQHPEIQHRAARFAGGTWADFGHFEWVPQWPFQPRWLSSVCCC